MLSMAKNQSSGMGRDVKVTNLAFHLVLAPRYPGRGKSHVVHVYPSQSPGSQLRAPVSKTLDRPVRAEKVEFAVSVLVAAMELDLTVALHGCNLYQYGFLCQR